MRVDAEPDRERPLRVEVDDEDVAVALALRAALDGRVGRDGVRAGVAFVGVLERDGDLGLRAADDDVGNSVGRALPGGSEVGVEAFVAVLCSARTGEGRDELVARIEELIGA